MHDMSNTRKEIAARLGFAAGNGAKESFASPDDISNMAQLLSRVESAVMNKRMDEARKLLKQIAPIVDRNRGDNELDSQGMVRAFNDYKQKLGMSHPGAKTRMTREQTEEQKAGLKIMSAADAAVGAKIAKLIKEGKPQDQAVAIALDMKRRGEL